MAKDKFKDIPQNVRDAYNDTIGYFKEVMAICNNAAWCISLDAYDELKKLPNWKKKVKGGKTVAECFKRVFKEFHNYESGLVYDTKYGLFDINSFPDEAKRKYGDHVTNRDLYDQWASIGATTYDRMRPLVTALQNKFRIGLEHVGYKKNVEIIAWALTTYNCIKAAVDIYAATVRAAAIACRLSEDKLYMAFKMFSLEDVMKLWGDACDAAFPGVSVKKFSDFDKRNMSMTLEQIGRSWSEGSQIFGDMKRNIIQTGGDIFRTKGFVLKEADKIQENLDDWKEDTKTESYN